MKKTLPRCPVLVDIDGTLTDDRAQPQIDPRHLLGNALLGILGDELVRTGVKRREVEPRFLQFTQELIYWDYADFIQRFRLPSARVWARLQAWHARHIAVYGDGVQMVCDLFERDYPLFIISNNPLTGCLLKLEAARLGSLQGTPWFGRIFCSNLTRGQKGRSDYWERAFVSAGLDPHQVVVVGNDLKEDFQVPQGLGIRHTFLVNRQLRRRPAATAGLTVVKSLDEVLPRLGTLLAVPGKKET